MNVFSNHKDVSQLPVRCPPGLGCRHALRHVLVAFHFQIRFQLFGTLLIPMLALKKTSEAHLATPLPDAKFFLSLAPGLSSDRFARKVASFPSRSSGSTGLCDCSRKFPNSTESSCGLRAGAVPDKA